MKIRTLEQLKTPFGRIVIRDETAGGSTVRTLYVDGHAESSVRIAPPGSPALQFRYMEAFSFAFAARPEIRKVLLIGGGGFAYPRYFLDRYKNGKISVSEISPDIIRLSRTYFGLDRLEKDKRFRLIPGDGFRWLDGTEETFDLIINDAFLGRKSIGRAAAETASVAAHLTEGGVYLVNTLPAVRGVRALPGRLMVRRVARHLPFVQMIAVNQDESWFDPREMQNCLLAASNHAL